MADATTQERVPPHSQEAEVAVLGAILLEPKAMSLVAPIIRPECFYRADHQKLYSAFTELYAKNQPIDLVSIKEELRRMKETDLAANADLFVTLGGAVPSTANAEHYAGIVREKFLLRSLITACGESLVDAFAQQQDVIEILDRAEQRVFNVATRFEASHPIQVKDIVQSVVDTIMNHPEKLVGVQTDYADLDHLTGGMHRGEFIVIGGRPSSGKTTFALNIVEHIGVQQGRGVLMFTLEMSREQIAQNLLCCHAQMDSTPLRTGKLDRSQWDKIRRSASDLYDSPVFIDDSAALSCSQLRSKCRRVFAQHPIELVVVDYLQLMSSDRVGRDTSRLQEITDISRGLKGLAKELNVPLVALYLSRAAVGDSSSRPKLSHLRESGAIEQDADVVMLLYRDDNPEPEAANVTELIVAKQRNGPTDTVKLTFRKDELRFESWSGYAVAQVDAEDREEQPF